MRPRQRVVLEMRAQHRVEQPGADDVVRLRAQVHRERAARTAPDRRASRRRSAASATRSPRCPSRRDRRRSRPARRAARRGSRPARRSTDRSAADPRAAGSAGRTRRPPLRVERIPDRKRHAEEPLPADAPVAVQAVGPVLEARLHVRRVPLQLAAAREQRLAELDRLDEPLPAGDDLERAIALLVELHGVRDRPRLADQVAGLAQLLDDLRARLRRRQPRQLVVVALRALRRRPIPSPARPTSTARSVPSG